MLNVVVHVGALFLLSSVCSLYPSEDEDDAASTFAKSRNQDSSSRRNSRRPSCDPNARRM